MPWAVRSRRCAATSVEPEPQNGSSTWSFGREKAWIIAAGAIAAYTGGEDGLVTEAFGLAALFAVMAFASMLGWAALGAGTARLLRDPAALRWFNRAMAALLVASLIPVLAS